MKSRLTWDIPAGMRDWLNTEASAKRKLSNKLLDIIGLWGYEEVSSPLLEFYHVLIKGEGSQEADYLYKLIDRDGSILALRPEMTTPIARIVSSKIEGTPPWRLMYGGHVFRYEEIQAGKQREFSQVGVELIGQKGPEADTEVLSLAIEVLKAAGLEKFTVSLGHTGVLAGLLDILPGEEEEQAAVRNYILNKDFVGLNNYLERTGVATKKREEIIELLTGQISVQDLSSLVDSAPEGVKDALEELQQVYEILKNYGLDSFIQIDLSTLRSQTYYTGIVFEIYTPGLGYPIGGGGRYDKLLCHFGKDYPATGFALGVERLLLSLKPGAKGELPLALAGVSGTACEILKKAAELREQGRTVITDLRPLNEKQAEALAEDKEARLVWFPGGEV